MHIAPWSPCGPVIDLAATTVGGAARQAVTGSGATGAGALNVRVCNNGTVNAFVAFGTSAVDASSDSRRMEVPAGAERVFDFPNSATHADAVMRSGTGTVSVQIGYGV